MRASRRVCLLGVAVLALFFTNPARAALYSVGPQGDYRSITAAVAAAAPGDVLRLAAGLYAEPSETYPVVIDKPLTLIGETGTVLQGPPMKTLLKVTAPDVTIENMSFQLLRCGIVDTGDRLTLTNCAFRLADEKYRVSSCGLWLAGVKGCAVTDCDFTGCGAALAGPPLSERSKELPVLTGLFEVGEDQDFFTTHTFTEDQVNGKPLYYYADQSKVIVPEDAGQVLAACCDGIVVADADVSDGSIGVELAHCEGASVERVTADRCGIFGVYLAHVRGGELNGVICRDANHGIDLRAVTDTAVSNCETTACEQGVFLSHAADCIVDACQIGHCGNGFFIAAGRRNQLCHSRVWGNENGVYAQNETDLLLNDNDITKNTLAGVRFLRSTGQITDNTVHDNWVGILAAENPSFTVAGNTLRGNKSTALYLRDVTDGKITGNRFEGADGHFVETDGTLTGVLFARNTLCGGEDRMAWNHTGTLLTLGNNWQQGTELSPEE